MVDDSPLKITGAGVRTHPPQHYVSGEIKADKALFLDAALPAQEGGAFIKIRPGRELAQPCSWRIAWNRQALVLIWGYPIHPAIPRSRLAGAILKNGFGNAHSLLAETRNFFAVFCFNRASGDLDVLQDPLGLQPFFFYSERGALRFATDARLVAANLKAKPPLDTCAVASWLLCNYNVSGNSLYRGIRRLPAGYALSVRHGCIEHPPSISLRRACAARPAAAHASVGELIITGIREAVGCAVEQTPDSVLPLSGGYDSRLLAAVLVYDFGYRPDCINVAYDNAEGLIAGRVAQELALPLEEIGPANRIWELHESVFRFSADGLPIGNFVTDLIARHREGTPLMHGFLGDSLIRGSHDRLDGKLSQECTTHEKIDRVLQGFAPGKFRMLKESARCRARSLTASALELNLRACPAGLDEFIWMDWSLRQRFYISNNFLLHAEYSEALIPFYDATLLDLRVRFAKHCFTQRGYKRLFERYYPQLAVIPHASELAVESSRAPVCRRIKLMAWELVRTLRKRDGLAICDKEWAVPRMAAAALGVRGFEERVCALYRLLVFERACHAQGYDPWAGLLSTRGERSSSGKSTISMR